MPRESIKLDDGCTFEGDTALDIVEQMRARAVFHPGRDVRDYIEACVRRGLLENVNGDTDAALAVSFITELRRNGMAR